MPLVRAWMRGFTGASGAAMLVPAAVVGAMVLLALAGSFGKIGGLGQAFGGPALPGPQQVLASSAVPHGRSALVPVASTAAPARAVAGVAPSVSRAVPGPGPTPRLPGPTGHGSTSGAGGGPPGPPPPPVCRSACPHPRPRPTLTDQVVGLGTSITKQVPGAVGQIATQLLNQVGAALDGVLPGNVRKAVASLTHLNLP